MLPFLASQNSFIFWSRKYAAKQTRWSLLPANDGRSITANDGRSIVWLKYQINYPRPFHILAGCDLRWEILLSTEKQEKNKKTKMRCTPQNPSQHSYAGNTANRKKRKRDSGYIKVEVVKVFRI
jgi:hypothetical protein